jgi:DNA-binding transcriptional regulator YiaG
MVKKIDHTIWVTQQQLAKHLGVKVQNVHNWVQRGKIDTLEHEYLPGIKIVLVNKETIRVDNQRFGRYKQK